MHDYLIDEITALRTENRLLREEVEARRIAAAELMRAISAPVIEPPRTTPRQPRETSPQTGPEAPSAEARDWTSEAERIESAISLLVDQLARTTERVTPDIGHLIDRLDRLNDELGELRGEIHALHRRQTMSSLAVRDSRGNRTSPRMQPLRANGHDIIIESTASGGLWQRLKQPWYYLPLAWGTLVIVAVLVILLVFFD